jgi:hypothetical protein
MKNIITDTELEEAQDYLKRASLVTTINDILDCLPLESGETLYCNRGEKWGDAFFYSEKEVPEMISACGWENCEVSDVLADGVEVPESVVKLAQMKPEGKKWKEWEQDIEWADDAAEVNEYASA